MDFWELTKLVFRRWIVALPLLLLTCAGLVWIQVQVTPDYRAVAHVQLIPPQVPPDFSPQTDQLNNPWAQLGPEALGQAVVLGMQRPSLAKSLAEQGLTENFSVSLDPSFPIVVIEAVGDSPTQAAETTRQLTAMVVDEIDQQQAQYEVTPEKAITTLALEEGSELTPESGSKRKVAVAVAGLGLLVTAGSSVAFDAVAYRRARTRYGRPGAAPWPARYSPTPDPPGRFSAGIDMSRTLAVPHRANSPVAGRSRVHTEQPAEATAPPSFPLEPRANGRAEIPQPTHRSGDDNAVATEPASATSGSTPTQAAPPPPPLDDSTVVLPLSRNMWDSEEADTGGRQ